MPVAALGFCLVPGCPNRVPKGRCPEHSKQQRAVQTRFQPGNYGRPWRRIRDAFIAQKVAEGQPWCVDCLKAGERVLFDEVDHIIPHRGDERLRDDVNNLQLLCKPHHSAKTAREVSFGGAR